MFKLTALFKNRRILTRDVIPLHFKIFCYFHLSSYICTLHYQVMINIYQNNSSFSRIWKILDAYQFINQTILL